MGIRFLFGGKMKQNYKLLLSYDGSRYYGFERQKDQELTIQGKLESVLSAMPRNDTEAVETFSSGRTDAGVCAAMYFWTRSFLRRKYKTIATAIFLRISG